MSKSIRGATSGGKPEIFETATAYRKWLEQNHDKVQELWLGFYNQRSGKTSITYREALDEALCFGWIDGVRKSVDETTFTQRFTPRKPRSYWSAVNLKRVEELRKEGRLAPPGLAALQNRREDSGKYSYETRLSNLPPAFEKRLKANKKAWKFFSAQAPWYRRTSTFWVVSAKKEETQLRRLQTLIADSEKGRRLGVLTPKSKRKQ